LGTLSKDFVNKVTAVKELIRIEASLKFRIKGVNIMKRNRHTKRVFAYLGKEFCLKFNFSYLNEQKPPSKNCQRRWKGE
jgi:hypothetical protein